MALIAGAGAALSGCEVDGWMGDPSASGRWENTPTIVPVLERIDVIEADTIDFVEPTPIMPDDLIPAATDYRLNSGDVIRITILDLFEGGAPFEGELLVDSRGSVDIPQLGRIRIGGMSSLEAQELVARLLVERGILLQDPVVSIQVAGARDQTFSVLGAVQAVGTYAIPSPDYRLLEALTDAGGVSPVIKNVYVIRQVPLTDRGVEAPAQPRPRPGTPALPTEPAEPTGGDDLLDLIDELTDPPSDPSQGWVSMGARAPQDGSGGSNDDLTSFLLDDQDGDQPDTGREPLLELPDDPTGTPTMRPNGVQPITAAPTGRWMFLNGKWVQVMPTPGVGQGLAEGADPLSNAASLDELVTQRVIKVPVTPLLQGAASYNIIIRPGDIIHVPPPEQGFVYAMGPGINRPGAFQLPTAGQMTILRLVASAGGMTSIANAQRVDLIRRVGDDRQAFVRLNVKAINEGTQPDIVLRSDDLLNFGTDFWATPLAVLRGGIRATYGFGFLLDRNFGNDVFGSPPVNRFGN